MNKRHRRQHVRASLKAGERPSWYRIENRTAELVADVYVYDEIGYYGVTASDFVRDLASVDVGAINLHINSPGGDVWDGIAIHNAIRNHPANVTVRIDGLAASAASFIAMAGDKIVIEPNAQMMIHDALCGIVGNAADLRELADMLDRTSQSIAEMYTTKAGGKADEWREAMKAETWYNATEAVGAGLADEIAGAESAEEDEAEEDESAAKVAAIFAAGVKGVTALPGSTFRLDNEGKLHISPPPVVETPPGQTITLDTPSHFLADAAARALDSPVCANECCKPTPLEHWAPDTGAIRDAMAWLRNDAPAPPPVQPPPVFLPALPTKTVAGPLDPEWAGPFDPSVFRAAVQLAANDAPAPYETAPPQPTDEFDPVAFLKSLKEATK